MPENMPIEELAENNHNSAILHMENLNEDRQIQEATNNSRLTLPITNARTAFNFNINTTEHSRMFANNISSTIEGIRPLIEQATGFRTQVRPVASTDDSYIINLEEQSVNDMSFHNVTTNRINDLQQAVSQIIGSQNNNTTENNTVNSTPISSETRAVLKLVQHYVPFVTILLAKSFYDHRAGLLMFIVLFITFSHANSNLKREIAKQHNRSWLLLLVILCYVSCCIIFVDYTFELSTLGPYTRPFTIWDLLYYVVVMDLFLKLITIGCKVLLTCLPVSLLAFQNRGKYYLMVEATSQLYRCVAPVQPWLYYLYESYQGSEIIVGILFSVIYTMSKGNDLIPHIKLFRNAIRKLFQNVSVGVSPSTEQLIASGGICAICHEEYSTPIRLHCKHIFCEMCVSIWLDRERSCPLCRASITDDPVYRDGHTTHFIQLY